MTTTPQPDPLVVALGEALDVLDRAPLLSIFVQLSFDLDDNRATATPEWIHRREALLELIEPRARGFFATSDGDSTRTVVRTRAGDDEETSQ